jgi:hypothetical protein
MGVLLSQRGDHVAQDVDDHLGVDVERHEVAADDSVLELGWQRRQDAEKPVRYRREGELRRVLRVDAYAERPRRRLIVDLGTQRAASGAGEYLPAHSPQERADLADEQLADPSGDDALDERVFSSLSCRAWTRTRSASDTFYLPLAQAGTHGLRCDK